MYSRRSIMAKIAYLLSLLVILQALKPLLMDSADASVLYIQYASTVFHIMGFLSCAWLFYHRRFDVGKWLLQCFLLSFLSVTAFLYQAVLVIQYFFLLAIFVSAIMFNERQSYFFYFFCVLYISLFLFFQHLSALSFESYQYVVMLNSVILATASMGCVWMVRKMTIANWRKAKNLEQAKSNIVYKVFPDRISGKLLSLRNNRKSRMQDLMYKAPMTIVFVDIIHLHTYIKLHGEHRTHDFVQSIFNEFDELIKGSQCVRIKRDGGQYVFVCELKEGQQEARACKCMSLLRELHVLFNRLAAHTNLSIRSGVATGEVSAGMVNIQRPAFDVWGQAVVLASRLEKSCMPMQVHCDKRTFELAQERFYFLPPSVWNFKGLGQTMTYQANLL